MLCQALFFFFYHTDLGQNLFFFALFKPIILQVFTILEDKLHSFNIQYPWASFAQQIIALHDHIIKSFHEERMPGLFSQKKSFQLEKSASM